MDNDLSKLKAKLKELKTLYEETIKKIIREICQKFKSFTPTQLLRYVYQEYPDWAVNSIAEIN